MPSSSQLVAVAQTAPANVETLHDTLTHFEQGVQRVRDLQLQARTLAREQVAAFIEELAVVADQAVEIAEGGDAYHPGVRELCTRVGEDMHRHVNVLRAIMDRAAHP